ncbi:MAG: OsmC family protein [Thermoplasmatota archaeon]
MDTARHVKGLAFSGLTGSEHWVPMDTKKEVGGITGGPTPMELVIQALIGCTGMDVVSILNKMKQEFRSFEVLAEYERSEEHPKVYTKIHMTYRFEADEIDHDKVGKAVKLSKERYCSVSAMLSRSVDITYHIEINGERI